MTNNQKNKFTKHISTGRLKKKSRADMTNNKMKSSI